MQETCHSSLSIFIENDFNQWHLHLFVILIYTFVPLSLISSSSPNYSPRVLQVSLFHFVLCPTKWEHSQWTPRLPPSSFYISYSCGMQTVAQSSSSTPDKLMDHSSLTKGVCSASLLQCCPMFCSFKIDSNSVVGVLGILERYWQNLFVWSIKKR